MLRISDLSWARSLTISSISPLEGCSMLRSSAMLIIMFYSSCLSIAPLPLVSMVLKAISTTFSSFYGCFRMWEIIIIMDLNTPETVSLTSKRNRRQTTTSLWLPIVVGVGVLALLVVFLIGNSFFPVGTSALQKSHNTHDYYQNTTNMKKLATKVFKPDWTNEGVGAKVIRIVGNEHLSRLDPFLMLDYFKVSLPAGFPDHPHRGFQTVTYMMSGEIAHEDFKGHKGIIGPGDIQWMTAGKGIVHAQMPTSFDVPSTGFQLWINLKSSNKMIEPHYQEFKSKDIPVVRRNGINVKVISGEWEGIRGPIIAETPAYYFDVQFDGQSTFNIDIPQHWNSIVFVYEGQLLYTDEEKDYQISFNHCGRLSNGTQLHQFKGNKAKFLVIAGEPISESLEQYGPFVMNSQKQLNEARQDYYNGRNGFGGARQWESQIKHMSSKQRQR